MVEAVAERLIAAEHPARLARHDVLTQDRHDALQRPHPAHALGAGRGRTPAHRLGPGEGADDRGDGFGENIGSRTARPFDHREPNAAAIFELVLRQPGLAQEPFERLRGGGGFGALCLLTHRLRFIRQTLRDQRQSSRSRVGDDLRGVQPGLGDFVAEQPRKIGARLILHPRGNFFGAEFEEEIRHRPTRCSPSTRRMPPSRDRGRGRYSWRVPAR